MIYLNGKECTIEELVNALIYEEYGGMDFDTLGASMKNEEAFNKVMSICDERAMTVEEMIQRYVDIVGILEVNLC